MIISEGRSLGSIEGGAVRYAWSPEEEPQEVFGYPPEGNVLRSRGEDLPADLFGLDGSDALHLPVNLFMVGAGSILAVFGTTIKDKTVDIIIRAVGGAGALLAVINLFRGAPKEEATKQGLGSEWAPEDARDEYLNRFYHAIDTTRELPRGLRGLGLGQIEYWIVDPEDPANPLIRSQCAPFMVGPGLEVVQKGPRGERKASELGSLGFWEVLDPSGMQVAVMQCRPHYTQDDLTVKQVTRGREILRTPGSAEAPEGTVRPRRGMLFTTRR